jgi:hypothetical protein
MTNPREALYHLQIGSSAVRIQFSYLQTGKGCVGETPYAPGLGDCNSTQVKFVQAFRSHLMSAVAPTTAENSPHGLFASACLAIHCHFTDAWPRVQIDGSEAMPMRVVLTAVAALHEMVLLIRACMCVCCWFASCSTSVHSDSWRSGDAIVPWRKSETCRLTVLLEQDSVESRLLCLFVLVPQPRSVTVRPGNRGWRPSQRPKGRSSPKDESVMN